VSYFLTFGNTRNAGRNLPPAIPAVGQSSKSTTEIQEPAMGDLARGDHHEETDDQGSKQNRDIQSDVVHLSEAAAVLF
jgi:hypothetical protein